MKNSHQLKSEKKIFLGVLLVMLIIVNAFTLYLAFSSARANIELATSHVVSAINKDTDNNRSMASDLGSMLPLPDNMLNKRLQIDIRKLTDTIHNKSADSVFPAWSEDIDSIHRKKFTIMRSFWKKFSDANKSRFTTYYTDGDAGYYYIFST